MFWKCALVRLEAVWFIAFQNFIQTSKHGSVGIPTIRKLISISLQILPSSGLLKLKGFGDATPTLVKATKVTENWDISEALQCKV